MFWFSCLMLHHLTIETFHVKCTEAHLTFVAKLKILPGGAKKMVEKNIIYLEIVCNDTVSNLPGAY